MDDEWTIAEEQFGKQIGDFTLHKVNGVMPRRCPSTMIACTAQVAATAPSTLHKEDSAVNDQREYAKGGLIEGPSEPDLVAQVLAKTSGCPTLSAAVVRCLGQLDKLPFRYPDCECGHTETVHSPDGGSCGDCDECHEYRPVES